MAARRRCFIGCDSRKNFFQQGFQGNSQDFQLKFEVVSIIYDVRATIWFDWIFLYLRFSQRIEVLFLGYGHPSNLKTKHLERYTPPNFFNLIFCIPSHPLPSPSRPELTNQHFSKNTNNFLFFLTQLDVYTLNQRWWHAEGDSSRAFRENLIFHQNFKEILSGGRPGRQARAYMRYN